jgi:hypothetical protein
LPDQAINGADVDDRTTSAACHRGGDQPGQQKRSNYVHCERVSEELLRHLCGGHGHRYRGGIVDQDVQRRSAGSRRRLRCETFHSPAAGTEVSGHERRPATVGLDAVHDLPATDLVPAADNNKRSVLGEAGGDAGAQASGGTGDQRRVAGQLTIIWTHEST